MITITLYPRSKDSFLTKWNTISNTSSKKMKLNFFILLYILCWCKVQPVDVCKYIYYLEWVTTKFIRVRFSSKWIQGCFYHLHKPGGGNSVHKHKTMEFDMVGGRPTTNYIQITFDSEDDYCTGCRNISHYQQLFRTTFTRMMKRNLILYPNQLSRLKRVEKYYIIAKHSPHIFWSFPNKMSQTIWFFNQNFQFSEVNGNYPRTSNKES